MCSSSTSHASGYAYHRSTFKQLGITIGLCIAVAMAACLYQQNRFDLDPTNPKSIETVFIPSSTSGSFGSRSVPKRRRVERPKVLDEVTFASQHIASTGSVFFSKLPQAWPRAILWRLLDNNQLLELKGADLYEESNDDTLGFETLQFRFDAPLIPYGVAFTEKGGNNAATLIHAVTQKGDVLTLSLRKEVFMKPSLLDEGPSSSKWWRTYAPSALKVRSPYRVVASAGDEELWITLNDGAILRLRRLDPAKDWTESIFSDATWTSSMRGLISWRGQATVRLGEVELGQKAACTVCASPTGLWVWTACLDHTLRAWRTSSGRADHPVDLGGNQDRDMKIPVDHLLDPDAPQLIQLIDLADNKTPNRYTLASYSPHQRAFKFWLAEEVGETDLRLSVEYAELDMRLPIADLIESIGWQLADFYFRPPRSRKDRMWTLWILVRSGSRSHMFTIDFDPEASPRKHAEIWSSQWATVHPGFGSLAAFKNELDNPLNQDPRGSNSDRSLVEHWMEWLLTPGHYSQDVLETALTVYQRGNTAKRLSAPKINETRDVPFLQRLSAAIASSTRRVAFETQEIVSEHDERVLAQLKTFNEVLDDLQKQREKTLALSVDPQTGLPWVIMADQASPIRRCADIEVAYHNYQQYGNFQSFTADSIYLKALSDGTTSSVGALMNVCRIVHDAFSRTFLRDFREAFFTDAIRRPGGVVEARMERLYEHTNFQDVVTDDTWAQFENAVMDMGGFATFDSALFEQFFELFQANPDGRPLGRKVTTSGAKTLLRGSQDTVLLELEVLLDVALIAIFTFGEIDQNSDSVAFVPVEIYIKATELARERIVEQFLLFTRQIPVTSDQSVEGKHDYRQSGPGSCETLMEELFLVDVQNNKMPPGSAMELLTYWSRAWLAGYHFDDNYDSIIPYLMTWLLKHSKPHLATRFLKFLPDLPWSNYVRARYSLATGSYADAAGLLQDIGDDMSENFDVNQYDSGGLLAPDQRNSFGDGGAQFWLHAVDLFEKAHVPSFANDFAKVALRSAEADSDESPQVKNQILSRLFTTSLQTSRFNDAFVAITRQGDHALRRPFLTKFIQALLSSRNIDLLLHLPWSADLAAEADMHLAELCTKPQQLNTVPLGSSGTSSTVPPHRLLYAWRIQRSDIRGAAAALWERIQMLKLGQSQGLRGPDVDAEVQETYLALINCLLLVDEQMRWLLVRPIELPRPKQARFASVASGAGVKSDEIRRGTRRIVTVEDARREYQEELDRVANLQAGRFPINLYGDDDTDEDAVMQDDTFTSAVGSFARRIVAIPNGVGTPERVAAIA